MLAQLVSATLEGVDAIAIDVEVDVAGGNIPSYHVVGMPAQSVREGGVRIRSALEAAGQMLPPKKITVNLAPADLPKPGTGFDLPIAVGVLIGDGLFEAGPMARLLLMGELGLDGSLRKVRGALAAAMLARRLELRGVVVPDASASEAAVVEGIEVYAVSHLSEVVAAMEGSGVLRRARPARARITVPSAFDLAEVRGQDQARTATEIAVAGGHNLLLVGSPGIGKTMLARRISTILPPLSVEEAIDITKIYSSIGLAEGLATERPFRSPHHTISTAALLGGGTVPRPGEISLAHHGVLFLDELPEFQRSAIEALRQPLEEREIIVGRAHGTVRFPAGFLLVASANPCPCGWNGSPLRMCDCGHTSIERYRTRLSGPLLDRIDLHVSVKPVSMAELRRLTPGESSAAVRERVVFARGRQRLRLAPYGLRTNAEMGPAATRATCRLDASGERELARIGARHRSLSARAIDRIIKVARTLADLRDADDITKEDLAGASQFRVLDLDPVVDPRTFFQLPTIPPTGP